MIMMFFAMIVQQSVLTIALFTDTSYEFVQLNADEDSEEKNHKNDDKKDESVQLHTINAYASYCFKIKQAIYTSQKPGLDFCLEILIPPPDLA